MKNKIKIMSLQKIIDAIAHEYDAYKAGTGVIGVKFENIRNRPAKNVAYIGGGNLRNDRVYCMCNKNKELSIDAPTIRLSFTNCELNDASISLPRLNRKTSLFICFDNCKVHNFMIFNPNGEYSAHYINNSEVSNITIGGTCNSYSSGMYSVNVHFEENTKITKCNFSNIRMQNFHNRYATYDECEFHSVDMYDVNLEDTTFNNCTFNRCHGHDLVCPEVGAYIAFKKARIYYSVKTEKNVTAAVLNRKNKDQIRGEKVIVKLEIPADAKRSSATTRKCRASKAKVLDITSIDGKTHYKIAGSCWADHFKYKVGETVEPTNGKFDTNRWNECAIGIHHFITREEAVNY